MCFMTCRVAAHSQYSSTAGYGGKTLPALVFSHEGRADNLENVNLLNPPAYFSSRRLSCLSSKGTLLSRWRSPRRERQRKVPGATSEPRGTSNRQKLCRITNPCLTPDKQEPCPIFLAWAPSDKPTYQPTHLLRRALSVLCGSRPTREGSSMRVKNSKLGSSESRKPPNSSSYREKLVSHAKNSPPQDPTTRISTSVQTHRRYLARFQ